MPELPTVGQEFAGYRIRSVIGRGGMSVVYQAENVRLGSVVALKVLAPELAADDRFRTRFLEESRLAASLNHPNVIPIYDMGPGDGLLYIAMRYVTGSDLRAVLKKQGGPLPLADALFLVGQGARALDAAHRKGLIHRDVKPANFLIERGGNDPDHVYLADFGITTHALSRSGDTPTGDFLGTIDYIAPEQIQATPVDGRADQYALGCVLYECLTGHVPFERDRDAAIIWAHVEDLPPLPSTVRPDLPAAVDEVFSRVLAKQADDRYPTCREFVEAADAALGSPVAEPRPAGSEIYLTGEPLPDRRATDEIRRPGQAGPPDSGEPGRGQPPPPPAGPPAPPPRRHRGRWIGAIAAALVLIIGAGIGLYVAGRDSSARPKSGSAMHKMTGSSMPAHKARASGLDKALVLTNTSGDAKGDLPPKTCRQKDTNLVECANPVPAISGVIFRTYPSLTALYAAYVDQVKNLASGKYHANINNCRVDETYGEISWNHMYQHPRIYSLAQSESGKLTDSQAVGRVFCNFTGGLEYLVWTQNDGRLLGIVYGAPHQDVWTWWVAVHHNIGLGGVSMNDMNMGS
jgi:serine/threonine-protein kinase